MTTEVDALILRYLQDLEAELHDLPANRRQELLDEVGEHIAAARAGLDPETEAGVRTMLERLGDPADIAAEARERFGVQPPPPRPATPWLEVIALVLLVIPFVGWVVGVVLVWLSRLWTTRDKLIGTIGGLSWVVAGLGTVMTSAGGSRAVGSAPLGPPETDLLALLNRNSYEKGGFVLHMLRSQVGEGPFFAALRRYYAAGRDGNAVTDDLRREMEAASGQQLSWFFDQWLRRPGFVEANVTWSYDPSSQQVLLDVGQSGRFGAYRFPLTVELRGADGQSRRATIEVPATSGARLTLKVATAPLALIADPDVELLGRITVSSRTPGS